MIVADAIPAIDFRRVPRLGLRLGPFAPPLLFLGLGSLWLSLSRLGLVLWQWPHLSGANEIERLFVIGARMDLALLCYLLALPMLSQGLLPTGSLRRGLTAVALTLTATTIVFMELVTPAFIAEYDHRPDRLFFEYLMYPQEVFTMLFKGRPLLTVSLLPMPFVLGYGLWRFWNRCLQREEGWRYPKQIAVFVPLFLVMFAAARGLDHRPLNLSAASFSPNRMANELAANSTFSVAYAAYSLRKEADASRLYGAMPRDEMLARVRKYMDVPPEDFTDPAIPTMHRQTVSVRRERLLNLVIIMEESLGADHVGSLGGLPLTPNLDRLSREGAWFTRLYATGTRTARGMEAIAAAFPPTPAPAVLKLPRAQNGFFTLGELLRRQGYSTEFIYGGVANFDNMRSFYLGNGFERVIEQKDFTDPVLLGSWGVSDEDWVKKAHETFVAHGDRPFFGLMMSTSNHEPFEFPDGRIEPYEQPLHTRNNAMKYADHAIGEFFKLARGADYFKNTVFVVVADHEARVYGSELLSVRHFRVPALIIGPGVAPQVVDRLASQIDLGPTLMNLLGIDREHPMIGHDLLNTPADEPGRALMQFEQHHGFRVGNKLVVHVPHQAAQTFIVGANDQLSPTVDDPELTRDALAHVLWASHAYLRHEYRLDAP